jgi:methylmalonyl-CoA mutase N-terminal domain/subunit
MKNSPVPTLLSAAPRQLSIPFDSATLRGMSPSERRAAVTRLASILLEAANVAVEEGDDEQR